MNLTQLLVLTSLMLAACGPSDADMQKTIAETEAAKASATVTDTPKPSSTFTPTNTPTNTPSPTPDIRVIDIDPEQLHLEISDIPVDGQYHLPNKFWSKPLRNDDFTMKYIWEEWDEHIATTGRVDGWDQAFARGASDVLAPEQISEEVSLYSTIEGANLAMDKFSWCGRRAKQENWFMLETDVTIGDRS